MSLGLAGRETHPRGAERRAGKLDVAKYHLATNTMHVQAQWPFPRADYSGRGLAARPREKQGREEWGAAARGRRAARSNQCHPLCSLTFEGLVIGDCWLLYLNVSPQLPGTADRLGDVRWPRQIRPPPWAGRCCHSPAGPLLPPKGKHNRPFSWRLANRPKGKIQPRTKPAAAPALAEPGRGSGGPRREERTGREAAVSAWGPDALLSVCPARGPAGAAGDPGGPSPHSSDPTRGSPEGGSSVLDGCQVWVLL